MDVVVSVVLEGGCEESLAAVLDRLCAEERRSRAALLREALWAYAVLRGALPPQYWPMGLPERPPV